MAEAGVWMRWMSMPRTGSKFLAASIMTSPPAVDLPLPVGPEQIQQPPPDLIGLGRIRPVFGQPEQFLPRIGEGGSARPCASNKAPASRALEPQRQAGSKLLGFLVTVGGHPPALQRHQVVLLLFRKRCRCFIDLCRIRIPIATDQGGTSASRNWRSSFGPTGSPSATAVVATPPALG